MKAERERLAVGLLYPECGTQLVEARNSGHRADNRPFSAAVWMVEENPCLARRREFQVPQERNTRIQLVEGLQDSGRHHRVPLSARVMRRSAVTYCRCQSLVVPSRRECRG